MQGQAPLKGRLGGLIARGAAPEKIAAARRELTEANARAKVRAAVAAWPPLSDAVKAELAIIILGGGSDAA